MDAEQAEHEVCIQAAVGLRQMPGSLKQESFLVVNEDSNCLIFINKAEKGVENPYSSSTAGPQCSVGTSTPLLQLGIQGPCAPDRIVMGPHGAQTDCDCNTLPGRGSPPAGTKALQSTSPSAKKTTSEAHKTSSSGDLQTPNSFAEGCFTFDGVFNLDTGQVGKLPFGNYLKFFCHDQKNNDFLQTSEEVPTWDKLFLEHVQPLLAKMPLGYSVSLLLCEAHCPGPQTQDQGFVQKILEAALPEPSHSRDDDALQTISLVQIDTDGKVQDLLNPGNQGLQMMDLPPLGLVLEKATEMVVADSQTATHAYLQGMLQSQECLQQSLQKQHKAMCGTLLTVTLEQRAEGQGLRRATLRILEFTGGDLSSADLFSPLSSWSADTLSAEVSFLSWVLKPLLTGNALTFVLFRLTLPEASGEEVLSTLLLAEQVKSVSKRVAPTFWDPAQEAQKRRASIGELRDQLFCSSHPEQESRVSQLGRMLKELQALKSQSWKEKKETAAYETKKGIRLEAKGQITSEMDGRSELRNQLESHQNQSDAHQKTKRPEDGRISMDDPGQATAHQEAASEEETSRGGGRHSKGQNEASEASSPSWAAQQDIKVRFSLAKAKRQCLQEQHRLLIQQELLRTEEKLAGQEKLPPEKQEALHWQKEKSLLTLRLEALQKEQAEAERDLEELYQEHLHEAEAQKQHILQVFQAYKGHAEEQLDTLERRYRKLLQRSLQDAILLSAQNQQLRDQRQLGGTDRATQTDCQPLKECAKSHSAF